MTRAELPGRRGYRVSTVELQRALDDAQTPEDEKAALDAIEAYEEEQQADEDERRWEDRHAFSPHLDLGVRR